MKKSKSELNSTRKNPRQDTTPTPPARVVDNTNTEVAKSIASLVKAIEGKDLSLGDDLVASMEKMGDKERVKYEKLITQLSSKMDNIVDTLKDRPTSFEFDVRRNQYGLIDAVLIKPIK